jgi:hypothetical protein
MAEITCKCGEKNCTTIITVESDNFGATVAIEHFNSATDKRQEISLDPNSIVDLIKQLRKSLNDLTSLV